MKTKKEQIYTICEKVIKDKNYDNRYIKRLEDELYEIEAQGEENYFLELYEKSIKYPLNENNILVPFLLGIVDDFDIEKDFNFVRGEFPDVDIDYLVEVRDYLKNVWAPERYGKEYVCSIGTYGTLGIKSSILDMAKIYGYDKSEIQAITVKMADKDEEGELLEWDKALELYPEFKDYCEKHVEVAASAKMLLDRNKSGGTHAGGLIIANCHISDFVPLEVRKITKENPDGVIVSAWSEGQATQDLQPVGLIKFDLLVVGGLKQCGYCVHLIKQRHNLKSFCALEGGKDWSDISYLNDPKSLELANNADLKAIFQFDSEGIRKLVKAGGVTSFDDLPAFSSLFRPGPMKCFSKNSKIKTIDGEKKVEELKNWHDQIAYINKEGKVNYSHKFLIWKTGKKKILKIKTKSGKCICVSPDHPILTQNKFKKAETLKIGEKIATVNSI